MSINNLYNMNIIVTEAPFDSLYQLVPWPQVQILMEYEWFRSECLLYTAFDDQTYLDSAYFVPLSRLHEIDEPD